jgi:hypothetical protein
MKLTNVNNIGIQFTTNYLEEYNEFPPNKIYDYSQIPGTTRMYPMVNFNKKDIIGYIRLSNRDMWLYPGGLQKITYLDAYPMPPLIVWFNYIYEGLFVVYRLIGTGLAHITKRIFDKATNILYLVYEENRHNHTLTMRWVNNLSEATKFTYDSNKWPEIDIHRINIYNKKTESNIYHVR